MKTVISTERIPIKLWLDDIEEGAMAQVRNLANLPFAFRHVAIMPDAHQGFGMPIGGVLATNGVIIPNAVGVDIGCGMCAVRTPLKEMDIGILKEIMGKIRQKIPVGFKHNMKQCEDKEMPLSTKPSHMKIVSQEWESARFQLGTLGGGNHFIEIQKGDDGFIWIMIHSGSRNIGKKVADYYNKLAKKLNQTYHAGVPKEWDLAFLPLETVEAREYIEEMEYCVDFALANRKLMMEKVINIFIETIRDNMLMKFKQYPEKEFGEMINIAHNYAKMENHFGKNVMIHRKGATLASEKTMGIIPGSQGTASYIVKGLGNRESFNSCSHGAGRKLGRNVAKRTLSLEDEQKKLNDKGIVHSIRNVTDLDEASGAYKDIDKVMENQKDLVEIVIKLEPLGVVKG